jgi:hypothetical protein
VYFPEVIIRHEHPVTNTNITTDVLYIQNQTYSDSDQLLFYARNGPPRLAKRAAFKLAYL